MLHKNTFPAWWRACITGTLLLAACGKDDPKPAPAFTKDGVAAVVNANFSLTLYNFALINTHYNDTLSSAGPFTVIAPSNNAFNAAGFISGAGVIQAKDSMYAMMPYCILHQRLRLDSLPLAFNQVITASNGQPLYVTHWGNTRDTAITVNGARISTIDQPASNGLVNIADRLLNPVVYKNVQEAVSGDASLSIFNAVLQQSGMAPQLQTGGPYTLFAPNNTAFVAIGINTTDSIYHMDPAILATWVKAHLVSGRRFVYDYILQADVSTNTVAETMNDGSNANITLIADFSQPGRFSGIHIQGTGAQASLVKSDVLAGNGVVHSISQVLTH